MKTDKRSDTLKSDLLGREITSLSPCFDWITYPLCDMNQVFNSTGSESMMDVSSAVFKDDMVEVSIVIPHGLLKSFVQLMGSLEGFFKHVSYKTRLAKEKAGAESPKEIERRSNFRKDFYGEVSRVYDELLTQDLASKKAVYVTKELHSSHRGNKRVYFAEITVLPNDASMLRAYSPSILDVESGEYPSLFVSNPSLSSSSISRAVLSIAQ